MRAGGVRPPPVIGLPRTTLRLRLHLHLGSLQLLHVLLLCHLALRVRPQLRTRLIRSRTVRELVLLLELDELV